MGDGAVDPVARRDAAFAALLDAMMACAGLRGPAAARVTQRGRKIGPREQRLNKALGGGRFGFGIAGFFVSILFLPPFADGTAWQSPLRWLLVSGVVGIIAFSATVLGYMFFATLRHHRRERLEKIQDRRALRLNGMLPPEPSFLRRFWNDKDPWPGVIFALCIIYVGQLLTRFFGRLDTGKSVRMACKPGSVLVVAHHG